jgi:hypothetical protein
VEVAMIGWKALLLVVAVAGVGMLSYASPRVSAAQGTLRVDPASQTVGAGAEFKVKIIQNADVATTGAQASLRFDPAVLELVNVEPGAPYASAQLLLPGSLEQAIADANGTGLLACVATFFVPGGGSVPAGDADFLVLTLRAKAGGTVPLRLVGEGCGSTTSQLEMIDENGSSVPVTGSDGAVTVDGAAPPPPGATPQGTPTVVGTPTVAVGATVPSSPAGSAITATPAVTAATGTSDTPTAAGLRFDPPSAEADKGADFDIQVKHNFDAPVASVSVQIRFSKEAAELQGIEPGANWADAQGASQSELDLVVDQAQQTGDVEATFLLQGDTAPAGDGTLLTLNMKAAEKDVTSPIIFVSVSVTDANGSTVAATSEGGQLVIGTGGGGRNTAATLTLGTLILLTLGGTAGGAYFMVQRRRRQWG